MCLLDHTLRTGTINRYRTNKEHHVWIYGGHGLRQKILYIRESIDLVLFILFFYWISIGVLVFILLCVLDKYWWQLLFYLDSISKSLEKLMFLAFGRILVVVVVVFLTLQFKKNQEHIFQLLAGSWRWWLPFLFLNSIQKSIQNWCFQLLAGSWCWWLLFIHILLNSVKSKLEPEIEAHVCPKTNSLSCICSK